MIREIRSRSIRVDMGETAGHMARQAGGTHDCRLRGCSYGGVEFLEAVPGDGSLERVVQEAMGDQRLAVIGRPDKGLAPGVGKGIAGLDPSVPVKHGPVVCHAFESAAHPRVYGMIGTLEGKNREVEAAIASAREPGLLGIDQAEIGRIEASLANSADRSSSSGKIGKAQSRRSAVGGPVLQPHPGLGYDPERSFRADHEAIGTRSRTRTRQSTALQNPGRRDHTQAFNEVVDVGVERGVVAAGAGRDPAAEGREGEGLWKMPEREPGRP